ncbi:MAG: hypothetical protein L6266_01680 [Nanoarchaeota archaeon]|nr:hypothetical protein [Nanoarchaeota archaeon]
MTSNLVKKVIQRTALFTGLVVGVAGFGGCATICEKDPLIRGILGGVPRVLQPGAYRNSIEREERNNQVNVYENPKIPENVYLRDGVYHVAPGYQWVNPSDSADLKVMSEQINIINGKYRVAPGYQWVNPNDNTDLRVRKIKENGK